MLAMNQVSYALRCSFRTLVLTGTLVSTYTKHHILVHRAPDDSNSMVSTCRPVLEVLCLRHIVQLADPVNAQYTMTGKHLGVI